MTQSTGAGGSSPPASALMCLARLAGYHGIDVTPAQMAHEHALPPGEPSTPVLLRIARGLGLKAGVKNLSWAKLAGLQRHFPVMARLDDGVAVIVVGMTERKDGGGVDPVVVDPGCSHPTAQIPVPRDVFCARWKGETLFVKRRYAVDDEERPFGLSWFIPELWRRRGTFAEVGLASLALLGLGLLTPVFFQLVIDKVLVHYSTATLTVLTVGVVAATLFEAVFRFLRQHLLLGATNKIDIRLATRTFSHLLALPIDYFERASAGVTVQHMQQAEKVRQFLTGRLFLTLLDSAAIVLFLPVLLLYSAPLTAVVLACAALMGAVIFALMPTFQRRLQEAYRAEAARKAMLVETIQGARTIKAAAIEPVKRLQWNRMAARVVLTEFEVMRISNIGQSATQCLQQLTTVAVIAWGALLVFDNVLTVGALVAFQMLAGRVIQPLVQIVSLIHEYQETALSVEMLGKVMREPPERPPGKHGLARPIQGGVAFDGVSFWYGGAGAPALDDVTFPIEPGQKIGVVGRSGSGKTTLTKLLQGFHTAQRGVVRVDGRDIRDIDLAHLRRNIGVVLQENFLFRGTVRENIAVTNPSASFEEIVVAAERAGATEFIELLPYGYDTMLEENAANLSGGQRQRLAIARALLPNPPILIFDEATSALDPESEAKIVENLAQIAANRTMVLVSHRLSMLVDCDKILVMDRGEIDAVGRHNELLESCKTYRDLWEKQNRHVFTSTGAAP
jgi:ATP-binding cassette, subfamily B, bacterial HlyB/CyaB